MEARIFGSNEPLPDFITFSQDAGGFSINSSDPNDYGVYQVELTATVDGPSNAGAAALLYTFTLDRCQLDRVTQSLPIPDSIKYSIGSGALPIDTNVSNLFSECPLLCELEMQEDYEVPSFVMFNKDECSIEINSADKNLNGLSFGMIFTAKDSSGTMIVNRFTLALEDTCEEANFIGADFVYDEATKDIFAPLRIEFTEADISADCGAFTYELLDGKTGRPLTPPIFTIDVSGPEPAVVGSIPTRDPYLANSPMLL